MKEKDNLSINDDSEISKKEKSLKRPISYELFDWIEMFTLSLSIVIILYTFLVKLVTVNGDSMRETLHDKDILAISNLFYTPKQGDIVALQFPELGKGHERIIKRIIATEGQTIDINFETWEVFVDGELLDEPYVNYVKGEFMRSGTLSNEYPITIEKGKIFVLGDNRNNSLDSRFREINQVDVTRIMGRVLIRLSPLNQFGKVKPDSGVLSSK